MPNPSAPVPAARHHPSHRGAPKCRSGADRDPAVVASSHPRFGKRGYAADPAAVLHHRRVGLVRGILRGLRGATPRELDDGLSPGISLRRAGLNDHRRALAASADPDAQRWIGRDAASVRASTRLRDSGWLDRAGGPGRPVRAGRHRFDWAALADDQFVGAVTLYRSSDDPESAVNGTPGWQVGVVLTPARRGIGLGSRLFRLAPVLAREVLGVQSLLAGCEPGNEVCSRALLAAGYLPCDGPSDHRLADGRVVQASWFVQTSAL
jgi:hypothetical protein